MEPPEAVESGSFLHSSVPVAPKALPGGLSGPHEAATYAQEGTLLTMSGLSQ